MTEWLTHVLKAVLWLCIYAALAVSILTCGVDSLALFNELPLTSFDKEVCNVMSQEDRDTVLVCKNNVPPQT